MDEGRGMLGKTGAGEMSRRRAGGREGGRRVDEETERVRSGLCWVGSVVVDA